AALLLPRRPAPPPLPPAGAAVRERPPDTGDLLEPDRTRVPERRLPDPANDDPVRHAAHGPPVPRPAAPPDAAAVPRALPPPGPVDHHAARLRPLAVLRDRQVQPGGGELRLPPHPLGRRRGAGAARLLTGARPSRRRRFGRRLGLVVGWGELGRELLQALELVLDLRPEMVGGRRHLAPLAHDVRELVAEPLALGLDLRRGRLERRQVRRRRPRSPAPDEPAGGGAEPDARDDPESEQDPPAARHGVPYYRARGRVQPRRARRRLRPRPRSGYVGRAR